MVRQADQEGQAMKDIRVLNIATKTIAQGNDFIDAQVTITAPGGSPGIDSVITTAIGGAVLDTQKPAGCPGLLLFVVKGIEFGSLPYFVEATECQAGVDQGQAFKEKTSGGPYGGEFVGVVDCKPPGQNLNNSACTTLQNSIEQLRNTILAQCAAAARIKASRDTYASIAAGLAAAAIALFAAAAAAAVVPIFGTVVAIALAIAAAALVVTATVMTGLALDQNSKLNDLLDLMATERDNYSNLEGRLSDVCCPEFTWVQRDVPLCPN